MNYQYLLCFNNARESLNLWEGHICFEIEEVFLMDYRNGSQKHLELHMTLIPIVSYSQTDVPIE